MSGHSKWSSIKHKKGAADAKRGKLFSKLSRAIMVAAKEGRPIPEGWALDAEGRPTTDPKAALSGAMLAMGGSKGALLALIVEFLCCALTGAAFGFEADSFFQDEGNRPRLGQALLVIDPGALAGADGFAARIETLIAAMLADEGVRLPGAKREAQSTRAAADGLEVPDALIAAIRALAA